MKKLGYKFIILLFCAGCATTARMYPVEGPLHDANKLMPLQATVYGIMGNNGRIAIQRHDGVKCEGEWSSAAGTTTTFTQASLMGQYNTHVSAVSRSSGGGQNPGQAVVICPDNNTYVIEFITGGGEATGYGIGKDRLGNVFRILF